MLTPTMPFLQRSSADTARKRGHNMSHFTTLSDTRAVAACLDCGREVQVDTRPHANGIHIGGEAVALNCEWASK